MADNFVRRLSASLPSTPLRCASSKWESVPSTDPIRSPPSPDQRVPSRSVASSPLSKGVLDWVEKVVTGVPDEYASAPVSKGVYTWVEKVAGEFEEEDSDDGDDDDARQGDGDNEPLANGADDMDASERLQELLMLLSLEDASVVDVLESTARCYSACVLEQAKDGGESTLLAAQLPRVATERLTRFLQTPHVLQELASARLDPAHTAILEMLKKEHMATQLAAQLDELAGDPNLGVRDRGAPSSSSGDGLSDGLAGAKGALEGILIEGLEAVENGSAVENRIAGADSSSDGDDDVGLDRLGSDNDQQAEDGDDPAWSRPAHTRRAIQAAHPSPPLLPPHELGWPSEDGEGDGPLDRDDELAQGRAASSSSSSGSAPSGVGAQSSGGGGGGGCGGGGGGGGGGGVGGVGGVGAMLEPIWAQGATPLPDAASSSTSLLIKSPSPVVLTQALWEEDDEEGSQYRADTDFRMEGRPAPAADGLGASEDEEVEEEDEDLPPWLRFTK